MSVAKSSAMGHVVAVADAVRTNARDVNVARGGSEVSERIVHKAHRTEPVTRCGIRLLGPRFCEFVRYNIRYLPRGARWCLRCIR